MVSPADDDPFRALEDARDPATMAWTAGQNARTRAFLDALPDRSALAERFDGLLEFDALGVPVERGTAVFYTARRGRARQAVLFERQGDAPERAIVDPAVLDPSGLTALDWWFPSPDGRTVAIGLSTGGDERSTLSLVDVATGQRSESIADTRYCSLAWLPDGSGFYYTRFPPDADYASAVYRHAVGTPWENDARLFGDGRPDEDMLALALSANGRYLVVIAASGWARSDAFVADCAAAGPPRFEPLSAGDDAVYDVLPGDDALFVRTNAGASRFRVYRVDPARLARSAWEEIVPEGAGTLDAFALTRAGLVLRTLEDVRSVVRLRRHDGRVETLGGLTDRSVLGLSAHERSDALYVSAASFFEPTTVLRFEVHETAPVAVCLWERVASTVDAGAYTATQEWFTSRDGTRIPMWVLHRRGVPRDGTAPAVLYGYGGFDVSLEPGFLPSIVPWLDAGGVYAVANLRGGGEFGAAWHHAGMRERKQNVFDDFIAAAEFLGSSGLADATRIAVHGGSNGGLLVAALLTQRPDLARAVVCAVPLTDMLRYHLFPIGRLWIAEYGDPDIPADAKFLRAYSPYHNVHDGTAYPATFIETAEADGRVDPMHAKKFAARIQAATSSDAPVLLFVEPNAGHGVGKPRDKVVAELADRWAFLGWALGERLT